MEIAIFKDITTEAALQAIESEALKYDGLYVEMEDKEQRKFVKDHASNIGSMLKRLDRARIDKSKEFKVKVEAEALNIKTRLEAANKPFTTLIEEYKVVRERQLEKEKALQAAKDLAFQLPIDHLEAIAMNELFDFKIARELKEQQERDDLIAENARLAEVQRQEQEKQAAIKAQEKLEANKKHVSTICGQAKKALMNVDGVTNEIAKAIVQAIAKKEITNVTINYQSQRVISKC